MQDKILGKAFVVGDNIDTDQIIPAEFLSYNPSDPSERKYFGMHALSGVPQDQSGLPEGNIRFVAEGEFTGKYGIVIGGRNFGCGSSREHAPLAMVMAGAKAVVAQSYARIFYRNSVNGGYLLPLESQSRLVDEISTGDELEISLEQSLLENITTGKEYTLDPLGDAAEIVRAGGVFEYAKQSGML